jgi:HK97 family phage portal protein
MALWPLDTTSMTWDVTAGSKGNMVISQYKYTIPGTTETIKFQPDEIWHLKDMIGADGVSGVSRISQVRDTIGLGISADLYGGRFFANDATPGGVLEYAGTLGEDERKGMVKSWDEIHKGTGKSFKTALLEGGMKFTPITMRNEDAQFIETRSFQVADIARIFRVPTIMIGGAGVADKSNTFASAEQQMLSFVQNTIRPWAVRLEGSISVNLLDVKERKNLFAEFKLEGLLRGDVKTRFEAYRIGREIGIYSVDEIRKIENLDPLGADAGGEDHIMPMNFKVLGEDDPEPVEEEPIEETPEEDIDGDE